MWRFVCASLLFGGCFYLPTVAEIADDVESCTDCENSGHDDVGLLQVAELASQVPDPEVPTDDDGSDDDLEEVSFAEEEHVDLHPGLLSVAAFAPYVGYKGRLKVHGRVQVLGYGLQKTGKQVVAWKLKGLDPKCYRTYPKVDNACGVHIHEGTSCYEPAGGHYWNERYVHEDPWKKVSYIVRGSCTSHRTWPVVTGYTNFDVNGRVIVVHDHTGARIACGVIAPNALGVIALNPYYNYRGDLDVHGQVSIIGTGALDHASQTMMWSLYGVDRRCCELANKDKFNSCGIQIHRGMSCASDALDSYWNMSTFDDDPWEHVTYSATKFSGLGGAVSVGKGRYVNTGLDNSEVNGHTVVVHDYEGSRVACGIIAPCSGIVNAFVPYVGYNGPCHKVEGNVRLVGQGVESSAAQVLSWELRGVDPHCKLPYYSSPANACGIHIHKGMSCADDAGGHYWNENLITDDPWAKVSYASNLVGGTVGKRRVVTGLSMYDVMGHTFIVHDRDGKRISCGIIITSSPSHHH